MLEPARFGTAPALALLAALSVAAPVAAQGGMDDVEIRVERVRGPVHALFGRGGNLAALVGEDGALLVDDQFAPLTPKIVAAVAAATPEGSDPTVRFVVNTHWHGDHTGGNENLAKRGAALVAHENVRRRLESGGAIGDIRVVEPAPDAALPVITFADSVTFHWNGETVRVRHLPTAHTDGDSILHFVESDVLHAGDVFFNGSYPFIDTRSGGSFDGLVEAVDRLLEIAGPETRIIPGHGPLASRADLQRYRDVLARVRSAIAPLVEQGLDADETVALKPTADLDERWGNGFMTPERFVRIVHESLAAHR